jgi:hypothetical protein
MKIHTTHIQELGRIQAIIYINFNYAKIPTIFWKYTGQYQKIMQDMGFILALSTSTLAGILHNYQWKIKYVFASMWQI